MKLKPRLKGTSDVGLRVTPEADDITPGKGKKDGNCNRTACQKPLKGLTQFYMKDMTTTNGRLYYCAGCEREFSAWDARMVKAGEQEPNGWAGALDERGFRCRPDEDNEEKLRALRYRLTQGDMA